MDNEYHIPVLLKKSVEGLNINPDGIYIDVTFGGGGHSEQILKKLKKGKLIAFDQDIDVKKNVERLKSDKRYRNKFIFFQSNFTYLLNFIKYSGYSKVDGILADLGVSSHQFNDQGRGFSFRLGGIPDMRMNKNAKSTALDILNNYSEEQLYYILKTYGELKSSYKLSAAIVNDREIKDLNHLNKIINQAIKTNKEYKILARVYQALRIETNKELDALKILITQSAEALKKGGRLVVISYHSLEDRLVKNYFKYNNFEGNVIADIYGRQHKDFKAIIGKLIVPEAEEIKNNNRARSAKLRIAERI